MKTKFLFLFLFPLLLCFNGCKKESVNNIVCDTTGWIPDSIRYSTTVEPLINLNCLGCHSNSVKRGNVTMEGYDHLKKYVDNDKLLGTIGHLKHYKPMPQNGTQLPQDQICKIKFWIDNGALNN